MLRVIYGVTQRLARYGAWLGVLALVGAACVTVFDVVVRRSLGYTVMGMVDITQLLVMTGVFLGIPYAFFREYHVGVDFITDALPPRALAALKALTSVLAMIFMLACGGYAWGQAALQIEIGDVSQTAGIPMAWYWTPLLLGCALSALACGLMALRFATVACDRPDPTLEPS